jgi:hypothetical protein
LWQENHDLWSGERETLTQVFGVRQVSIRVVLGLHFIIIRIRFLGILRLGVRYFVRDRSASAVSLGCTLLLSGSDHLSSSDSVLWFLVYLVCTVSSFSAPFTECSALDNVFLLIKFNHM